MQNEIETNDQKVIQEIEETQTETQQETNVNSNIDNQQEPHVKQEEKHEKTAEELAQQRAKELENREIALAKKELQLNIKEELRAKDLEDFQEMFFVDKYIEDTEILKEDISKFAELLEIAVKKKVEVVKVDMLKGNTPQSVQTKNHVSNEYEIAKKNGNILAMITSKLK